MNFGERIKRLRENKGLLQRQIAASLYIDTPNFSKIERGERKAKKEQVDILARLLDGEEEELLTCWFADKLHEILEYEWVAREFLKMFSTDFKTKKQRVPVTKR